MSSIATRTGDDGTTSLLFGRRVRKDDARIEAVGCVDELNAALGLARAAGVEGLEVVQRELIALMGELSAEDAERYAASSFEKLGSQSLQRLDRGVEELERGLELKGWALPGANARAAALDWARVCARRAERQALHLSLRRLISQYLNRLSDWLWLLARKHEV